MTKKSEDLVEEVAGERERASPSNQQLGREAGWQMKKNRRKQRNESREDQKRSKPKSEENQKKRTLEKTKSAPEEKNEYNKILEREADNNIT